MGDAGGGSRTGRESLKGNDKKGVGFRRVLLAIWGWGLGYGDKRGGTKSRWRPFPLYAKK